MEPTKKRIKKEKKPEVDPALLQKRKFRRKCQFKACVRLAWQNAYWLNEAPEYEGYDDVKRMVAQAMRKTRKKRLLSLEDKVLLNKPAADRTDKEKMYIYRIIGGLKCFSRYPNNVKRKLAAVTYFKYFGPGRVIVRENHEGHAMYFIVSGDVAVTQLVFDDLFQIHVPVELGVLHAGEMFGEISLLHNIPRSATCTTVTHCELLVLMRDDFKNILQACVKATWDKVRQAMSYFTYFDSLDEVARREGCIMAKMKSFSRDEVILGDGHGLNNFVYFVLDGHCQMIENLDIITTTRLGRPYYTLYDPHVSKIDSDESFVEKVLKRCKKNESGSKPLQTQAENKGPSLSRIPESSSELAMKNKETVKKSGESGNKQEDEYYKVPEIVTSNLLSILPSQTELFEEKSHPVICSQQKEMQSEQNIIPLVRFNTSAPDPPLNIRTVFMQVCQYNPGSTFGFGENMRDRRIVALTTVNCMLLPIVWLQQRNVANIWTRIQHFLNKTLPNKRQLFNSFVTERRWVEYKNNVVEDVVAQSHTVNWTSVHDVPYSIRLEEMYDV